MVEIMNKTLTICMRIFKLRHVIWRRCESLMLYQMYLMFREYVCRPKYQVFTFNVKLYQTLHKHRASWSSNKVIKEIKTAILRTTCTWD